MANELISDQHITERSWQAVDRSAPDKFCRTCGTLLSTASGQAAHGIVLRAAIPQPIAAALLLTNALSSRERTVFQLLGLGYDNRSLARELEVSERTVKRHVTVILKKLNLESRLQAGLTALIIQASSSGGIWPEGRMDLVQMADDTD